MPNYRRVFHFGGTYFFTLTLQNRLGADLLTKNIDALRLSVLRVKKKHPFIIHAWVVLPDHMHCVIELPSDNFDFPLRLRLIKSGFSRLIPTSVKRSTSCIKRKERGIWQRRYWEHLIRDEDDYVAHMDYVHFNPVKHGLVDKVHDWPFSTFHKLVRDGVYSEDWGGSVDKSNTNYGE